MLCAPGLLEQGSHPEDIQGVLASVAQLGAVHTAAFPRWNGMPVTVGLGLQDGCSLSATALQGIALVGVSGVSLPHHVLSSPARVTLGSSSL